MADILVTTTLEDANGFTDDSIVSSMAFRANEFADEVYGNVLSGIVQAFWNQIPATAIAPLSSFLSSQIARTANAHTIRCYDITGRLGYLEVGDPGYEAGKKKLPPHGSPFFEEQFTLGAAADPSNLPPQIANVVTLRARNADLAPAEGPGGIRPKQRVTGRIYMGKLNNRAAVPGDASAGNFPRPDGDFQTTLLRACEDLADDAEGAGAVWCVWSRTTGSMSGIVASEVDDSWDVIRSRKTRPTVRVKRVFADVPDVVLGA